MYVFRVRSRSLGESRQTEEWVNCKGRMCSIKVQRSIVDENGGGGGEEGTFGGASAIINASNAPANQSCRSWPGVSLVQTSCMQNNENIQRASRSSI